jgi:hypothetical protein
VGSGKRAEKANKRQQTLVGNAASVRQGVQKMLLLYRIMRIEHQLIIV